MKKILIISSILFILVGCNDTSKQKSIYSKEEQDILNAYHLLDEAENNCDNPETVKKMLKTDFKEKNLKQYCSLKVDDPKGVNKLISEHVSNQEIEEYSKIRYFNSDKIKRYIKIKGKNIKDNVIFVNMDLDKKPYEDATVVTSIDEKTLINKYNQIYEGYKPKDLVKVNTEYTNNKKIKMNKKAYEKFKLMQKDAKLEGVDLIITKAYLNDKQAEKDYLSKNGEKFKPGYNEHQTGYAIDLSKLSKKDKKWLKNNAYKYGFIIRYQDNKKKETLYDGKDNHLRYVGVNLARYLHKKDMSLEYYYATR